ncbi:unnamed protein product [Boreogadus saida]
MLKDLRNEERRYGFYPSTSPYKRPCSGCVGGNIDVNPGSRTVKSLPDLTPDPLTPYQLRDDVRLRSLWIKGLC